MPSQNIHVLTEVGTLEELYEAVALFQKQIKYLINGQMDVENIRAKSLTADVIKAGAITADEIAANAVTAEKIQADSVTAAKIDVDQLSAISANLGTITAGLMQAVTIIGSYIATANGTYPRSEMDVDDDMFAAYFDENNYLLITPNNSGVPSLLISNSGSVKGILSASTESITLLGLNKAIVSAFGDIELNTPTGLVKIPGWNKLYDNGVNRTLQEELNSKATSGANTGSAGGVSLNGGIPIGTVLSVAGGGTVTWAGINVPDHEHPQI